MPAICATVGHPPLHARVHAPTATPVPHDNSPVPTTAARTSACRRSRRAAASSFPSRSPILTEWRRSQSHALLTRLSLDVSVFVACPDARQRSNRQSGRFPRRLCTHHAVPSRGVPPQSTPYPTSATMTPDRQSGARPRATPPRPVHTGLRSAPHIAPRPLVALPSRSEEHTSELQSRENLVCRLLLEKKK